MVTAATEKAERGVGARLRLDTLRQTEQALFAVVVSVVRMRTHKTPGGQPATSGGVAQRTTGGALDEGIARPVRLALPSLPEDKELGCLDEVVLDGAIRVRHGKADVAILQALLLDLGDREEPAHPGEGEALKRGLPKELLLEEVH